MKFKDGTFIQQTSELKDFFGNEALYYEKVGVENVAFDITSGVQYADNELILTISDGTNKEQIENIVSTYGGMVVGYIGITNTYQIRFKQSYEYSALETLKTSLEQLNEIDNCEINYVMDFNSTLYPNDSEWEKQWESIPDGDNWGMEAIHAPEAWEYNEQMSTVNVGIYDTSFYEHNDLVMQEVLGAATIPKGYVRKKDLENGTFDENNFFYYSNDLRSDKQSHGMHVAGIIGATYNNKKGVCGVFPKAQLYGVSYWSEAYENFENTHTSMMEYKVGLTYLIAQKGCKVVNCSFGYDNLTFAASRNTGWGEKARKIIKEYNEILGEHLSSLLKAGYDFVLCVGAGNQNSLLVDVEDILNKGSYKYIRADEDDIDAVPYYGYIPYDDEQEHIDVYEKYEKEENFVERIEYGNVNAEYDYFATIDDEEVKNRIIVVGAAENQGNGRYKMAAFSNCGTRVDIAAPGKNIKSTVCGNANLIKIGDTIYCYVESEYKTSNGTSMATPFVSGVAAMIYSVNDSIKGDMVKQIICNTAQGSLSYTDDGMRVAMEAYSYPMLDAEKAIEKAIQMNDENQVTEKPFGDLEGDEKVFENVSQEEKTPESWQVAYGNILWQFLDAKENGYQDVALENSIINKCLQYEKGLSIESRTELFFALVDLDDNGNKELLIGLESGEVLDIFTYTQDSIIRILKPNMGERYYCKICDNGIMYTWGSGGASSMYYEYYKMVNGGTKCEAVAYYQVEYLDDGSSTVTIEDIAGNVESFHTNIETEHQELLKKEEEISNLYSQIELEWNKVNETNICNMVAERKYCGNPFMNDEIIQSPMYKGEECLYPY